MNRPLSSSITAVLALAAVALAAPATLAQKHDSNTLHKLGNAIQYPVRKAATNTSITAHRAAGQNSVAHRRNGNRTYRSVITPGGHVKRLHALHPRRRRHH